MSCDEYEDEDITTSESDDDDEYKDGDMRTSESDDGFDTSDDDGHSSKQYADENIDHYDNEDLSCIEDMKTKRSTTEPKSIVMNTDKYDYEDANTNVPENELFSDLAEITGQRSDNKGQKSCKINAATHIDEPTLSMANNPETSLSEDDEEMFSKFTTIYEVTFSISNHWLPCFSQRSSVKTMEGSSATRKVIKRKRSSVKSKKSSSPVRKKRRKTSVNTMNSSSTTPKKRRRPKRKPRTKQSS